MNFLQNLLVRPDEQGDADANAGGDANAAPEAERLSQDELRRRRLARLEAMSATAAAAETGGAKTVDTAKQAADATTAAAQASSPGGGASASKQSPSSKPVAAPPAAAPATVKEPSKKEVAAPAAPTTSASPSKPTSSPPAAQPTNKSEGGSSSSSKRDSVNDALVQLFRFSLSPPALGTVLYLPLVAAEINSRMLSEESIDAALYGRLYSDINDLEPRPTESPLRYIMSCLDRLPVVKRQFRADENAVLASALEAARKLLINYAVTYLTEPGLFSSSCLARSSSGPCEPEHEAIDLLKRPETSANFVYLLQTILPEVISQKCGKSIVLPILQKLSQDQKANKNETLEHVLSQLCCARVDKVGGWGQFVAEILADERVANDYRKRRNFFDVHTAGRRFEAESILGPFFTSPQIEFEPGAQLNQGVVLAKSKVLLSRQGTLKQAVMEICRAGESARDEMLKWFEQALELNLERAKDRPDQTQISTPSFMINVCAVLLYLCEPFLNNEKSTATLPLLVSEAVDCLKKCAAYPSDATVLGRESTTGKVEEEEEEEEGASSTKKDEGSSSTEKDEGASTTKKDEGASSKKKKERKFKFQTRAFVLALRAVDLGPIGMYRDLGLWQRQLRFLREDDEEQSPHYKALLNAITTYIGYSFEPNLMENMLSLASLCSRWIMSLQLNLAGDGPAWNDRSNLFENHAALFDMKLNGAKGLGKVPEFIVGDIADVVVHVGQHVPNGIDVIGSEKIRFILDFFIVSICAGDGFIAQPHMRANMGDAIFYSYLPEEARHQGQGDRNMRAWAPRKGAKELALETSSFSVHNLVPALMRLYGDVQVTGYYQVAAHRQLITKVLGYLWTIEPHRPAFRTFAETSLGRSAEDSAFIKLANGILNQTNSNVAESLAKLREIRKTQMDMKDSRLWSEQSEEVRTQRVALLESNEKEVSACLTMANDATDMLAYLSTDSTFVKAFCVPALRSRLVDMLCNILNSLGSKKATEFKIDNPEKYNFYPKKMLEEVFQTLLNCAKLQRGAEQDATDFVRTVAASAYYDYEIFLHAAKLIRKHGIVSDATSLDTFSQFIEDCERAKRDAKEAEDALGEAPDEFLDPLMSTVMDDPVILPSSKITVDRSTIMNHLLQNSKDPFDRSPLDASMLKEDTELKAKIQAWKKGGKA